MKNIFLTQGIYKDKNNSLFFKTDINWIIYSQKLKFNIIQINSLSSLNTQKVHGIIFSGGNDLFELSKKPENLIRDKLEKKIIRFAIKKKIPCFGVLGDLILNFSKILNQKATHEPSAQHVLDEDYYKRIEAIQFTMNHDDGNNTSNILDSDIILIGVSRTSKTPTSIYLANKGLKTSNIPLVNEMIIPQDVMKSDSLCVIGLVTEAERLFDIRRNRLNSLKENEASDYTNLEKIRAEVDRSKKIFKQNKWPIIDVTRKSVEETAASIIKIYEIKSKNV